MPWPTPQDYNEAIQNPGDCFSDPELKAGAPELMESGLPRPITGNFATVYRMQCNTREWAVRCFLREYADQQERYSAISRHLSAQKLPYTVGFEYVAQGIRVGRHWYPIVKMEWVHGDTLCRFLGKHLDDSATLLTLAGKWLQMVQKLARAEVAHGDLQHGNILVVDGDLKLIDYDGMFVPELTGRSSHEVGHRNYQHPKRSANDFGPDLDRFSAWVIYVSIVALGREPSLRHAFTGDEHILFRKEDFEYPESSSTLNVLRDHSDAHLRVLAATLSRTLYQSLGQVPPLVAPLLPPRLPPPDSKPGPSNGEKPMDITWITDVVFAAKSGQLESFAGSLTLARLLTGIIVAVVAAMLPLDQYLLGSAAVSAITEVLELNGTLGQLVVPVVWLLSAAVAGTLALAAAYHRDPSVRKKREYLAMLREAKGEKKRIEAKLLGHQREKAELEAELTAKRARLARVWKKYQADESRKIEAAERRSRKVLEPMEKRQRGLLRRQDRELEDARRNLGAAVASLTQQLTRLPQDKANELAQLLMSAQQQSISSYLRAHSIREAPTPGSHYRGSSRDGLIRALESAGIRTAADVSYNRVDAVHGFGPVRTSAIVQWRDNLEQRAKQLAPRALTSADIGVVNLRYTTRQLALQQQLAQAQGRLADEENAVRVRYSAALRQAADQLQAAQQERERTQLDIRSRYAEAYLLLNRDEGTCAQEYESRIRALDEARASEHDRLWKANWEVEKANHDWQVYEAIRFRRYVTQVLLGRAATGQRRTLAS